MSWCSLSFRHSIQVFVGWPWQAGSCSRMHWHVRILNFTLLLDQLTPYGICELESIQMIMTVYVDIKELRYSWSWWYYNFWNNGFLFPWGKLLSKKIVRWRSFSRYRSNILKITRMLLVRDDRDPREKEDMRKANNVPMGHVGILCIPDRDIHPVQE